MSDSGREDLPGRNRRRELANRRINYTQEAVDWASIVTSASPRPTNQDSASWAEPTTDQGEQRSPSPAPAAAALPELDQDEIIRYYQESLQQSQRVTSRASSHGVLTLCEYGSDDEDAGSQHETTVHFRESPVMDESSSSTSISLASVVGRVGTPWSRDPAKDLASRMTTAWASTPVPTLSGTSINQDRSATSLTTVTAFNNISDVANVPTSNNVLVVANTDASPVRMSLRKRFRRFLARVTRPFRSCLGLAGRQTE